MFLNTRQLTFVPVEVIFFAHLCIHASITNNKIFLSGKTHYRIKKFQLKDNKIIRIHFYASTPFHTSRRGNIQPKQQSFQIFNYIINRARSHENWNFMLYAYQQPSNSTGVTKLIELQSRNLKCMVQMIQDASSNSRYFYQTYLLFSLKETVTLVMQQKLIYSFNLEIDNSGSDNATT